MVESTLNCEQVWREISNYVDGDVDTGMRLAMDEHFKTCARCGSVLTGTRNVVKLYGDERMLELPAGFSQRLENRLARNPQRRGWSSWSAWLVPAAAVGLIVASVLLMNSVTFKNYVQSHHAQPANNVPPNLVVVVSDGSKLFHVPGCPFIHDKSSERTMTAKEAMQDGYVPCTRCLRQYLKTGLVRGNERVESAEAEEAREEMLGTAGH